MKRILLLSIAALFGIILSAQAQTQQGYVKTKGRMVDGKLVPGQGLKGASVSVHGRTAVLVHADDGAFSFPVPEVQFRLDSVRKKGYQLVDMDALSKTYKPSANPIFLVMETPEQQQQDQLTAERKIRRNLQKQLQEKEDLIEELKAQQQISDEEYRTALQRLYSEQESNEQLIADMAKRYSKLDYDQLDEFYRQVSYCIENGELVKADSLLNSRGDITAQVGDILHRGQALHEEREQLQKAEAMQKADIEEAARRCYSYFETFAAQHLNDTALYFLELRSSLDTTNSLWSSDVGDFIYSYGADYDKALTYYHKALRIATSEFGENDQRTAGIYSNLGLVLQIMGRFEESEEYAFRVLNIWQTYYPENFGQNALAYSNLGSLYYNTGDFEKALEYYDQALEYHNKAHDSTPKDFLTIYNNLSVIYNMMEDNDKALEYMESALSLYKSHYSTEDETVGTLYCNLSDIHDNMGNDSLALDYANRALSIFKITFGDKHPKTAIIHGLLGSIYNHMEDYDKALENNFIALNTFMNIFGEEHPYVSISYNNIGITYQNMDDYHTALEYMFKSKAIQELFYDSNDLNIMETNNSIAISYAFLGEYDKALEYFNMVLAVREAVYGPDHPYTQNTQNKIAKIKAKMQNPDNK